MRIFFIVPYMPRPIRTRPYYLLRALRHRGHSVTLATLWQSRDERACVREWEAAGLMVLAAPLPRSRWLWNCLRAVPTTIPLQAVYAWQPRLVRQIEQSLADQPFDVIHVEHLRGSCYGLHLRGRGIPIVWDSVDCISLLFEQTASRSATAFGRFLSLDLGRTRAYEPWLAAQFEQVLITSPTDKAALERLAAGSPTAQAGALGQRITVLPNGVDLDYFQPAEVERRPGNIVFSGRMSYHVNVTAASFFARQVMPLVWQTRPDATFTIAGYDPVPEVRLLARDPRIIVTGTVPDLRPYLQQAQVAVAPMPYGAGIQNKVLEAMACATPVVTTPQPMAALQATPGVHLLVAEDAAEFAQQVLALLQTPDLCQQIGRAGRRYVEENHTWARIVAQLEGIYEAVSQQAGEASHR